MKKTKKAVKQQRPQLNKKTILMLRQIQVKILDEPRQFFMYDFFTESPTKLEGIARSGQTIPNCGTAACIGGWAITMAMGTRPDKAHKESDKVFNKIHPMEQGRRSLGLTKDQSSRLFIMGNWPFEFNLGYSMEGTEEFALNAVRRINHFIKTDGKE